MHTLFVHHRCVIVVGSGGGCADDWYGYISYFATCQQQYLKGSFIGYLNIVHDVAEGTVCDQTLRNKVGKSVGKCLIVLN